MMDPTPHLGRHPTSTGPADEGMSHAPPDDRTASGAPVIATSGPSPATRSTSPGYYPEDDAYVLDRETHVAHYEVAPPAGESDRLLP